MKLVRKTSRATVLAGLAGLAAGAALMVPTSASAAVAPHATPVVKKGSKTYALKHCYTVVNQETFSSGGVEAFSFHNKMAGWCPNGAKEATSIKTTAPIILKKGWKLCSTTGLKKTWVKKAYTYQVSEQARFTESGLSCSSQWISVRLQADLSANGKSSWVDSYTIY